MSDPEMSEVERLRARCAQLEAQVAALQGSDQPTADSVRHEQPGRNALFSAIQTTRMPMILTDPHQPDNPIIFANRAFVELSGYPTEELIGRNCRFLQGPDADPDSVRRIREAITARERIAIDILNYRKDGSRFVNELYISPVYDADGELLYFFGSQVDVTKYTEARVRLQDSETKYRALFEAMDEGFCIIEFIDGPNGPLSDYVHVEANAAYARNAGIENVVGQRLREMVGDEADGWVKLYGDVYRTGEPVRFTRELEATGRELEVSAFRLEPSERRQVAVLFNDVTVRRNAERALRDLADTLEDEVEARTRELQASEEALRQSQKMEAVGQLTGGLAHDFNNLLTGVMGNLELLQSRVARGRLDDLDRLILAAQGAGRRAASLTQRLLAFSRRQTLDPKPTDVNRLVSGMEELLRRTVGAAVVIEIVGAAGLWTANIDASQLENALLNLCINARDAMPDGGRLTIETANKWLDDRAGKLRDLEPGQYLSVCVTDTGTGMSAETIARAFEPFFTTKPIGQGTGLGLSMIYGFARQSGGQVRIYSELGQGTTICIYLPRHLGAAETAEVEAAPVKAGVAAGQTVLVVDDEATIRHLIDEVLDDLGYAVIGAADGAAGLKVLESGARIDLLITDVGLPNGMNGRQVADAARQLRPGLKILFITGYAENAAVGNGHLEAGMELLTKPFTLEALATKVAEITRDVAA